MQWPGPVSVVLHAAAIGALLLRWQAPPPTPLPPIELTLLAPAETPAVTPPPPPEPSPPLARLPDPEPLPDPPIKPPPDVVETREPDPPLPPPPRKHKPKLVKQEAPKPEPPPEAPPPTQVAAVAPAPLPVPAAAAAPPSGPPPDYLSALVARLQRYKEYPSEARRKHQQGTAMLRFTLARDGHVLSWKIDRSAGAASLDEAVERMIERAQPLPPMPAELLGLSMELVVPISFVLR